MFRYFWTYGVVIDIKRIAAAKNANINLRQTLYVGYRDPTP